MTEGLRANHCPLPLSLPLTLSKILRITNDKFAVIDGSEEESICPILTFFKVDQKKCPNFHEDGFATTDGIPQLRLAVREFVDLVRLQAFAFCQFLAAMLLHRLSNISMLEHGEISDKDRLELEVNYVNLSSFLNLFSNFIFLSKSFYLSAISEIRTSAYSYQRLCIRNVHAIQSVTQSEWNNHSRSFSLFLNH